jgi:hypothetical protein
MAIFNNKTVRPGYEYARRYSVLRKRELGNNAILAGQCHILGAGSFARRGIGGTVLSTVKAIHYIHWFALSHCCSFLGLIRVIPLSTCASYQDFSYTHFFLLVVFRVVQNPFVAVARCFMSSRALVVFCRADSHNLDIEYSCLWDRCCGR